MSTLGKHSREDGDQQPEGGDAPAPDASGPAAQEAIDPDDSDDDVGPMPLPADSEEAAAGILGGKTNKRRRVVPHEKAYLTELPKADRYYRSFMHRDVISHVLITNHSNFLLTASVDGHLKFWKKQSASERRDKEGQVGPGIEFVKHYRAHLSPILACVASADGLVAATVAADGAAGPDGGMGSVKVFDVENFDMINMLTLSFVPKAACWVHGRAEAETLLAISEEGNSNIHLFDGKGDGKPIATVSSLHRAPVHLMAYNERYDVVVSADTSGMIEYWQPKEPFEKPDDVPGLWEYKSSTDLYEFKKTKSRPCSLTFNHTGTLLAISSLSTDRQIRIFNFLTGKMYRKYDESLAAVQEMQQAASRDGAAAGGAGVKLDDMEFGRRLAVERELEKSESAEREKPVWDETGTFLIYPSLLGIKMVNVVTNRVSRILGKDENNRFLHLSLFQGSADKKKTTTIAMAASENPLLNKPVETDPILFCTAYKRSRFYLFGQEEPESDANSKGFDRDVYNERPTREEQTLASLAPQSKGTRTANFAIMHTDKGDIHLRLFPDVAPKAVENFVVHAKEGYYDGLIFHRVIKKFMIQTGDPLGDGTGGDSIWGHSFEDEFSPQARHDRPYTLSMANAGPRTNGSQFFITTVPCTWLDNKHTVFGRAVSGLDTVHAIENVRVDKSDKPYDDVRIMNIDIS